MKTLTALHHSLAVQPVYASLNGTRAPIPVKDLSINYASSSRMNSIKRSAIYVILGASWQQSLGYIQSPMIAVSIIAWPLQGMHIFAANVRTVNLRVFMKRQQRGTNTLLMNINLLLCLSGDVFLSAYNSTSQTSLCEQKMGKGNEISYLIA